MEIVERLDGELLLRVGERKQTWAMRFESGLQNSHSDELEDFLPQKTFDQMKDTNTGWTLFPIGRRLRRDKESRLLHVGNHIFLGYQMRLFKTTSGPS